VTQNAGGTEAAVTKKLARLFTA